MITCYYCKGKHELVAQVKACSVKTASPLAAKVEIGTVVEDAKKVTVPAHRTSAKYLALKAQVAPAAAAVAGPVLTEIQSEVKKTILAEVKMGQSLEIGMYQLTNAETGEITIYKVKFNKHSTYKYAEKLSITGGHYGDKPKGKFVFAPGIINKLTSNDKMTEEQAKAFHDATKLKYGQDYGFCCVCGKLLTNKKSIDAGIGPKCATYFA